MTHRRPLPECPACQSSSEYASCHPPKLLSSLERNQTSTVFPQLLMEGGSLCPLNIARMGSLVLLPLKIYTWSSLGSVSNCRKFSLIFFPGLTVICHLQSLRPV